MESGTSKKSVRRRPTSVILLACIALVAIVRLRMASEETWIILCESLIPLSVIFVADRWLNSSNLSRTSSATRSTKTNGLASKAEIETRQRIYIATSVFVVGISPWIVQSIIRSFGAGTGWEIVGLSSIGWAALSASVLARKSRTQSSSVICSGFLTLAATCSSDSSSAVLLAILWGVCCLWWLVSKHWQRFQHCQASTSVEALWYRPVTVLAGCGVFALAAWSTAGRFPTPQRLGLEVAPTSGGTSSNDAFARSGVGDGDAVVAAREHAASFGAVDSDIFLDSDQPSLFDLYSETFGEPIRKQTVERAIALSSISEIEQPQKTSESEGSGASFTTQRGSPKPREIARDSLSDAVLFWIGRAGMHLAMERFTEFDGVEWRNPVDNHVARKPGDAIATQKIGDRVWFSGSSMWEQTSDSPFVGARAEAIKYAGLKSPKIPTAPGIQAWHLQQVDDPTLFLLGLSDELSMAGRERVPDYTILRFVNREMDLQRIEELLGKHKRHPTTLWPSDSTAASQPGVQAASELASAATAQAATDWEKVQAIVHCLHNQFELDRSADFAQVDDPLAKFIDDRRGTDAMFATTAAVMLQSLGYRTRLVTGFITRSENRVGLSQEFAIYPTDTHAWIEIEVGSGHWIPLEPTPGFPSPHYNISWTHWVKQSWPRVLAGLVAVLFIFWGSWQLRTQIFDCVMLCFGWGLWFANDVQRSRALVWLIDKRCRLIGLRRPKHVPPRQWLNRLGINDQPTCRSMLDTFFGEADRLCFGSSKTMTLDGRRACYLLWRDLTCGQISKTCRRT